MDREEFSHIRVSAKLPENPSRFHSASPAGDEEVASLVDATTQVKNLDTGFTAWSQVLVSHLLVINGFGYISSFGLFQLHWETVLNRSDSDISWVGSLQLFLLFFVGTVSGRAMDAGYFRSLIVTGCSMQLLGVFTTSVATRYWHLVLSQGVVQGLGNGILFTPAVALVSTYFVKRRAFALGVAVCGAPVGGIVFPKIARQLMPHLSYEWIIRVMGFVMLFNTAIILLMARPRHLNTRRGAIFDISMWREKSYALFGFGIFLVCWGLYFAYFYTTTYSTDVIHMSSSTSLVLLDILNAVGIPGRLVPSLLADRYFGPFKTLLPFSFCCGILLLSWMAVSEIKGFTTFVVIYGICANAVQTLFPSALASLTSDLTKMGVRVGMVFTLISIACLTGPPIAGALIAYDWGEYYGAQLFGGVTVIGGSCVLSVAYWTHARNRCVSD